jgi:tetratricopeptide (TPR) repeat protein
VQQPWASAICAGEKTVENRSRSSTHRGLIAIHAGAKKQRLAEFADEGRLKKRDLGLFPLGAILGTVELVDVVAMNESLEGNPWAVGPQCWVFRNARTFRAPIPCPGKLNLYSLSDDLSDKVRQALAQPDVPPTVSGGVLTAIRPGPAAILEARGSSYRRLGDTDNAIRCSNQLLKLDPGCPPAFLNRGVAYFLAGRYLESISDFDEVLKVDPENANVYWFRANALYELGEEERAETDYAKALELDPSIGTEDEDESEE